ncbi:MAG: peptidoglycan binding domain-containing protein, partial [Chloroflexota bacterium]|nr:peptidoglycan binding domain-containing protein [Chloroflexota bacterium]
MQTTSSPRRFASLFTNPGSSSFSVSLAPGRSGTASQPYGWGWRLGAIPRVPRAIASPRMLPECAVLLFLSLGLMLVAQVSVARAVAPGVEFAGVKVGGLSVGRAETLLSDRAAALVGQPLTLRSGERVWTRTYTDLGLSIDVAASVALAPRRGLSGEWNRLVDERSEPAASAAGVGLSAPLVISIDAARFAGAIGPIESALETAPVDAVVAIDGLAVIVHPGRDGSGLDSAALRADLIARLKELRGGALALPLRPLAAEISTRTALGFQNTLSETLSGPLTVRAGEQSWILDPARLGPALTILTEADALSGDVTLRVRLKLEGIDPLLEPIFVGAAAAPVAAHVDESDAVPRLVPAVAGGAVDRQELVAALELAIAAGQHEVVAPVVPVAPAAAESTERLLMDLGITTLLATGASDFAGSDANRVTNVRIATELIDGVLVCPGTVFSFNAAIGVIV